MLGTDLRSSGRAAMALNLRPRFSKLLNVGLDSEYTKWPELVCFPRIQGWNYSITVIRYGMCRQTKSHTDMARVKITVLVSAVKELLNSGRDPSVSHSGFRWTKECVLLCLRQGSTL